jgi:hypothetical protein
MSALRRAFSAYGPTLIILTLIVGGSFAAWYFNGLGI